MQKLSLFISQIFSSVLAKKRSIEVDNSWHFAFKVYTEFNPMIFTVLLYNIICSLHILRFAHTLY